MEPARDLPNWQPPNADSLRTARRLLRPWTLLTSPVFLNSDRVPRDRPVMFIVNHTLMGMVDTPLLMLGVQEHTGHFPRSMADHFHFTVPGWRDILRRYGAVEGTRDNCRALLREKHSMMIFPGGGREVFKRRGEAYKLLWGKRAGFALLAREFAYTIVPVASVGAEECYRILLDADDIARLPLGKQLLAKAPRHDVSFPTLVSGLFGTPLPRPQRFYFSFGHPIESAPYKDRTDNDEAVFELREEVRVALEAEISALLAYREQDPDRPLSRRLPSILKELRAP
ncbi:MAG: lysophospholipid acyltransferase family protein [Myxococcales bacterium]